MTAFAITALASETAERIRSARRDDSGRPLAPWKSDGGLPCRHCLSDIAPGGEALLFTHSPFGQPGPYYESGPIFVCAEDCPRYSATGAVPPVVLARRVVLRAYDKADHQLYELNRMVEGKEAAQHFGALLGDPGVAYLHVRSPLSGCFLCKVERP